MTTIRILTRLRVSCERALALLMSSAVGAGTVYAQTPPVPQSNPQVIQQSRQIESNATQERQARDRWRREAFDQRVRLSTQRADQCPDPGEWQITSVKMAGVTAVDRDLVQRLIDRYRGQHIVCRDIARLRNEIYELYDKASLPLTQVYLDDKLLEQGVLGINVSESRLEAYAICKNGKRRVRNTAFPLATGDTFTLDALDQGIENVEQMSTFKTNTLYPQDVKYKPEIDCEHPQGSMVTIKPGSKEGYGVVTVQTYQPLPFFASIGADNFGGRSTGRTRVNASIGLEDVLGLYERFAVQASHTSNFGKGESRARNLSGDFSVPAGYWRLSLSGNYFDYRSRFDVNGQPFVTSGDQSLYAFDINRVIGRDQTSVWSIGGGLEVKDSNNFINGLKLATSSRQLTLLNASVSYRTTQALGGSFAATLGMTQGLKQFGALNDARVTRAEPHAQFTQISLTLNYGRSFGIGTQDDDGETKGGTLRLQSFASGSYAPHALYGTEKVQIGGPFTVRGFDDASLSGDVGGFSRNELAFYPYMPSFKLLGRVSLYGGLDTGIIVRDYANRSSERTLAGLAGGLRLSGGRINAEARIERAIAAPSYLPRSGTIFRFNIVLLA